MFTVLEVTECVTAVWEVTTLHSSGLSAGTTSDVALEVMSFMFISDLVSISSISEVLILSSAEMRMLDIVLEGFSCFFNDEIA